MNNKIQTALTEACATLGINVEHETKISLEQATKLIKILKEEYGIDAHIASQKKDEEAELKASMEEYIIEKKPALEFCGTPPDGKQRRKERRALERKSKKNKIFK